MSDPTDRVIDAVFRTFGLAASRVPAGGGAAAAVTVLPVRPDPTLAGLDGASRLTADGALFELRASEVAAPGKGDTLTVGAQAYKVSAVRAKDVLKKVFILDCRKA